MFLIKGSSVGKVATPGTLGVCGWADTNRGMTNRKAVATHRLMESSEKLALFIRRVKVG